MAQPYNMPQSVWDMISPLKPGPLVASNDDEGGPWVPYRLDTPDDAGAELVKSAPKPKPAKSAAPAIPAESSSLDVPLNLDQQMAQSYQDMLTKRQANVDDQSKMLDQIKASGKTGMDAVDLKPLLAYADSLYGTKVAPSYAAPESPQEHQQKVLALQQAYQKSQGDLSDDQMNYLKMKADNATKLQHYQQLADTANMRADLMRQGLDVRKQGLDLRSDVAAGNVGEKFNGGLMKQYQGTLENLNRADSLLNGDQPITTSAFNLLQNDFINAMSPGGAATEGKINREMINDFQGKINHLKQQFGEQEDLRKTDPKTVAYIQALITHIKSDYAQAQARQAQNIADAHGSATNPKIQQTVKQNLSKYPMPATPNAGAGASPYDNMSDADLMDAYNKKVKGP